MLITTLRMWSSNVAARVSGWGCERKVKKNVYVGRRSLFGVPLFASRTRGKATRWTECRSRTRTRAVTRGEAAERTGGLSSAVIGDEEACHVLVPETGLFSQPSSTLGCVFILFITLAAVKHHDAMRVGAVE